MTDTAHKPVPTAVAASEPPYEYAPPYPGADHIVSYEESLPVELRRIMTTGTAWFAGAIIAVGVPLAGLLAAGWRPHDMPLLAAAVWWVGSALTMLGIAGFAWAGCPVLAWPAPQAYRQKSICIRGGVGLFLAGTVLTAVAVLSV
jgi:hypothetical protein